jgi:energy-coupling factor transporter ATP-binding protein EcfA2
MIKSFKVIGLWGHQDYEFSESLIQQGTNNLNIVTGRNGTGKTTILKLMWYMLSGHIRQAFAEIDFKEAELISTTGEVKLVRRDSRNSDRNPRDKSKIPSGVTVLDVEIKGKNGEYVFSLKAIPFNELYYFLNEEAPSSSTISLFFPTFRRVEGGFTFGESNDFLKNESTKIVEGFRDFSKRMSHRNHKMIAFADFDDVRLIVNEISSDIATKLRPFEDSFTKYLSELSNGRGIDTTQITKKLKDLENKREQERRPLTILSKYIDDFFFEKSVKITEEFKLGTHPNSVDIEYLSAGEKNFLSFLVYAMGTPNRVMFIDEPELTLHMDWQRVLLPIMLELAPHTQFFIATHAATIYSNYPNRDIWLDSQIKEENVVEA